MNLFASNDYLGWSCDDAGLAVFFKRRGDYERASNGVGNPSVRKIHNRFQRLLECGDADVESALGGIYIPASDAVRLDSETRELFLLPERWPGYFRLDAHSVPNLDDFDAVLRIVGIRGHTISNWTLRGPVLEIGAETYLPDASQFACLRAFEEWRGLTERRETDHLRFIHALADASGHGCRVDVSQAGKISPVTSAECCVDTEEQPDGSLLLTPLPLIAGLEKLLKSQCGVSDDPKEIYRYFRKAIMDRLGQLEGLGNEAVLRIGSVIIILDEQQTAQARGIARTPRVPKQQKDAFRRDPEKWLAENVFVHGEVEFLPRVIGIGEWSGGYLGAAGELGEKIDWFDKKPESEAAPKKDTGESKDGGDEANRDFESNDANDRGPLVPIIEKNDEDLGWGLRGERAAHPDTVCVRPQLDRYPRRPFPHQEEAVLWLAGHAERCGKPAKWEEGQKFWGAGALLADDMGLGKTLSTLLFLSEWHQAWVDKVGDTPPACLVVCPLSLVDNWRQEIEIAFTDDLNPFSRVVRAIPDGSLREFFATPEGKDRIKPERNLPELAVEHYGLRFGDGSEQSLDQPGTIVLTTYTTLRDYRFSFAGCNWNAVIFDEAQNIKNPNALQTVAAKALKGFFRIALSGTPVENHLGDLWSLMDTVEPGALGSFNEFRTEWIHPIRKDPSQLEAIGEALRERLDPLILRRTKEGSLKGLPKKSLIPIRIKMTAEQAALYDEILHCANAPIDDERPEQRSNRWLASMWELRRISLHPALLGDASVESVSNARRSRDFMCRSAKLDWLLERLDGIRANGEKVLIFSIQKKLQDLLSAHLSEIYGVKVPVINGDTKAISSRKPNETRLGLIAEFSNLDGFGICVLSPIAAGAGLNITAANHVIHLERHWNPAKEDQATDRAYRIGQTKDVHIYLPMLEHPTRHITTFDTGLDCLMSQKKRLAGSLGLIPVQPVSMDELFDSVIKGAANLAPNTPVYLSAESACALSWELFEALIAEIFDRESDRVILTSRGRDHGTDVVAIGHGGKENILIQVKTTKSDKLDSEEAIREVEGSLRYFESALGVTFTGKILHSNARGFSKRTRKAAAIYDVRLEGEDWLRSALKRHCIRIGDVIARNGNRQSL
jgi:SNF2 family DNA or RNA helicase